MRAILAAAQRQDWQAAIEHYDPDVELDMVGMREGGRYSGSRCTLGLCRRWFGTWDRLTITPEQFIEAGDRVVVVLQMGPELPIDPVCRMAIDPGRAAERRVHNGVEYVFCSDRCAMTFDESPETYRADGRL